MDLNALLRRAVELGASDVHLKLDQPPMLRRDGSIAPIEDCPLSPSPICSARSRP